MTSLRCRQVFNCEAMQLLQRCSFAGPDSDPYADPYSSIAALPAGRVAAAHDAGIDVLVLDMAGSELAPAGPAGHPRCAAETVLSRADAFARCALATQGLTPSIALGHAPAAKP